MGSLVAMGAVEETVTVSGAAPVVDTQTVRQQTTLSQAVLDTLPTGNTGYGTIVATVPGFTGARGDVGGSRDTWAAQGGCTGFHDKAGTRALFDGMRNQHQSGTGGGVGYVVNAYTEADLGWGCPRCGRPLTTPLNGSSILSQVAAYGARWRRPLDILDGRLVQLSGQVSF